MVDKEVYQSEVASILARLGSDLNNGLSEIEASLRLQRYGSNVLTKEKKSNLLIILLRQFKSVITWVLLASGIMSFLIRNHTEGVVILCIVGFVVFLGFIEEYSASKEMEALKKLTTKTARVIRERKEKIVPAEDIVPGDIILLRRGEIVPADARVCISNSLMVSQASLTGESASVGKNEKPVKSDFCLVSDQKNIVFASSHVINGDAICVVVNTGKDSEVGKISTMVSSVVQEATPLQKNLDNIGKQFSAVVIILCLLVLIVGIIRGNDIGTTALIAVAIAVSGIPEGLLPVIAIALSIGMKRMAKKNAIMKKLAAVEVLGTCTVICTDKTGTLTQNKMVVEKIFTLDNEVSVTGNGFNPNGLFMAENKEINPKNNHSMLKTIEIGVMCNNSDLVKENEEWKVQGEPTEGALIVLAKKAGIEKDNYHGKFPRIHEHPFDADRKCMSAVHTVENQPIVYTKGAPEMILKKCRYCLKDGKVRKISRSISREIMQKNHEYASQGLLVMALAYKEHKKKSYELQRVESDLVFVGLVTIRDPPEPFAKESIALCKEAGIKVVMITGDNEATAAALAKDLGIMTETSKIINGIELERMNYDEFIEIVDKVAVYARTTPKHKLKIVEALQKKGHIVAMTGDGVNDAPALKKADIGIAMGKCGTEVAKESAEMVIKDDNFSTIVEAVKEGRTIYSNILKFVYYILPGNFSEVTLILLSALLGFINPLTPLMILFINMFTSDIPALGLCFEKPSNNIMKQKPRGHDDPILGNYIMMKIKEVVPLIVFGTLSMFSWELLIKGGSIEKAQTAAFATIIMFEIFHVFNAKTLGESVLSKRIFKNPILWIGTFISVGSTIAAIYLPMFNRIFGTVPLDMVDWGGILIASSTIMIFVEMHRGLVNAEIKEREKINMLPTRDAV